MQTVVPIHWRKQAQSLWEKTSWWSCGPRQAPYPRRRSEPLGGKLEISPRCDSTLIWSAFSNWRIKARGAMKSPRTSGLNDDRYRRTILVADDNASILAEVSTLLARNFEVVAAVTDGRQALHAALRLDPELAVLDVTMPNSTVFKQPCTEAGRLARQDRHADHARVGRIRRRCHRIRGAGLRPENADAVGSHQAPSITRSPGGSSCPPSPLFLPSPRREALAGMRCSSASTIALSGSG